MRIKFLNKVNIILSTLLAALGCTTCTINKKHAVPEVEYGPPYEIYGPPYEVFNEANGNDSIEQEQNTTHIEP